MGVQENTFSNESPATAEEHKSKRTLLAIRVQESGRTLSAMRVQENNETSPEERS
jgi:hypothetical protein